MQWFSADGTQLSSRWKAGLALRPSPFIPLIRGEKQSMKSESSWPMAACSPLQSEERRSSGSLIRKAPLLLGFTCPVSLLKMRHLKSFRYWLLSLTAGSRAMFFDEVIGGMQDMED